MSVFESGSLPVTFTLGGGPSTGGSLSGTFTTTFTLGGTPDYIGIAPTVLNVGTVGSGEYLPGPSFVVGGMPPPAVYVPRITAGCYNRYRTLLTALPDSFAKSWQAQLNETGTGTLTLQADDVALPAIPYRSIIVFSLDGAARFAMLVEDKATAAVKVGEEHDQVVVIKGRGTLAILEEAVVYPEPLITSLPFTDTRLFSYASIGYDDSSWSNATVIKNQGNIGGQPYYLAPSGWPDGSANWIWVNGGAPPYPIGEAYFRKSFTAAEGTHRVFASADDGYEVYLDGARLMGDTQAFLWGTTKQADVFLSAGSHTVAIHGTNIARPNNPTTNIASVLLSVIPISGNGQLGIPVVNTDGTWKCLGYPFDATGRGVPYVAFNTGSPVITAGAFNPTPFLPTDVGLIARAQGLGNAVVASVQSSSQVTLNSNAFATVSGAFLTLGGNPIIPGMTIGVILRTLVTEAQNRGALGGVVLGFTDASDSAGVPWSLNGETAFAIGMDYLSVVRQLADTFMDMAMDVARPVLRCYRSLGATQAVTLAAGTNLIELSFAGKG